ncbi:MAG: hypothetical protein V7L31_06565 [Nostoc sp.]|uniref:hypothetical protein n=1 Tax=Nostoc sp. TaxID=1180 RepID=UPI002FF3C533
MESGETKDGGTFKCDRTNEAKALSDYQNKKLSDFYSSQVSDLLNMISVENKR